MKILSLIDRTEFRLGLRVANEGIAAVRPMMRQRQHPWGDERPGFNCARVLAQCDLMFTFHPNAYTPDAYNGIIRQTIEACLEHESYINLVVYADENIIHSGPDLWYRLGKIMQEYPGCGILSAVNEENQPVNHVQFIADLQPIDGVICSRGSNGGDMNLPPLPPMGPMEVHINLQDQWWRKSHNPMEDCAWPYGLPGWVSEHDRPDQDRNIQHHADAAGIAALLTAGYTFHSQEGKYSDLYGPSLPYAQAVVERMRRIPEKFITGSPTIVMSDAGQYLRLPNGPGELRHYQKRMADGSSWDEVAHE